MRIFLLLCLSFCSILHAQVGIGTTTPSDAAMLEVSGETTTGNFKGFMPPRVGTEANRDAISPTINDAGLLVFVQSTGCLDIWNGTAWENVYCLGDSASVSSQNVWINEFHYDNTGADIGEFVEIAGEAGVDLNGYVLLFTNGGNGAVYNSLNLSGIIPDEGSGFGAISFSLAFGFQNGGGAGEGDGLALIGPGNTIIQNLSYEGSYVINEPGSVLNGTTTTNININEPGNTPVGQSLQLLGTGGTFLDFTWQGPAAQSPGVINTGQTIN
jgi:hypothetical protein